MPANGEHKTFPNGRSATWDGQGWLADPVQRTEPGSQNMPAAGPSMWERIKGMVKTPGTTGQLASLLAPETGGLSYAIPGAVGAVTSGAQDIGAGKSASDVMWDMGKGAVEGMVPKGVEDTLATAGPALVKRGAALAEAGAQPGMRVLNAIRHMMAGTGAVGAVTTGHMVLPAIAAAEEAAMSPAVNTAVGKGMTALSQVPKVTRNFVQNTGSDILPGLADASAPSIRGVQAAASPTNAKAAFAQGVVDPNYGSARLPQVPAKQTVEDLLGQGVPLDEAIVAASKGEPAGMSDSLHGLYKAAAPTPSPDSPATYVGFQEDETHPQGGFHLFNDPQGSTVTADTLQQRGIPVPAIPPDVTPPYNTQLDELNKQAVPHTDDELAAIAARMKSGNGTYTGR